MQKKNIDKIKGLDKSDKEYIKKYLYMIEDIVIDEVINQTKSTVKVCGEEVRLKPVPIFARTIMLKALYNHTKGKENKIIEDALDKIYKYYTHRF